MKRSFCLSISAAFLLMIFGVSVTVTAQSAASDKKVVEQLFAAWNSRDADKFAAQFTDDALYEDVAAAHVTRGRDGVRKWAAGAFRDIENFKIKVVSTFVHDGHAAAEWVWSGRDSGLFKTGKEFSVRGVSVIEIRNGKISSYREYYDFLTVMKQLGLLPGEKK